jgi:transmembrane sensor
MNAPLSHPLRDALREPFTDADLAPLWPAIEQRRHRARSSARVTLGLTFAAAVATLALVVTRSNAPPAPRVGPLRLDTGAPFLMAEGRAVTFDDRSHITLSTGGRVEARTNDAHVFDTVLTRGRARFDVTPRGPRRWSIDCGLATVYVVGTSFVLDRSPERVHVEVLHGVVRVEGENVPGRAKVLRDGESLDVRATVETPAVSTPVTPEPVAQAVTPPTARVVTPERWRSLAAERQYVSAWDALGPGGALSRARTATADELLVLGEVAHRSRHYAEAAELYGRFVTAHASNSHASMVAFTLGRLQIDQLGDAREAARSFETALRLGVPHDLQEDVYARRVEAHARAGDVAAAREAAEDYLQNFPEGRRAADVRRWAP